MSENNATMSAEMPASAPAFGSDVKRLPLKDLLKRIGPGLIATGIVIGPGAVTTASMIGANYGYDLMWLFFPIIFMGITFMMVTNRLAIVTGMPTIHAIRKYYGPVASGIVGCAMFLSCLFFTMGNISGTGAGMNLIFGLDWKIGSAIMIAVVVYMYFAKNVYSKVEKIITLCIVLMIVAFYATLVGVGGPEPQGLAKGLFGFKVPEGSLSTALAFISTNAAVTAGIYGTYLGKEKKWKKDDLFNGVMLTDAITHIVSVSLISGAIVLVGAVVLHPQGHQHLCQLGRGLDAQPGEQVHPHWLPGLPGLCHGGLLQLRRFSYAAHSDGKHRHLHRYAVWWLVHAADDLAQ